MSLNNAKSAYWRLKGSNKERNSRNRKLWNTKKLNQAVIVWFPMFG